jgi:hypothetical protein
MRLRHGAVWVCASSALLLSNRASAAEIQGYGAKATGGAGGEVCTVTNRAAQGAGSFSDCARRGNVIVQFNGPGPFVVDGKQTYLKSNTTIDGCANGQKGVTLSQPADIHRAVVLEGPASNLVIRCIRFQGSGKLPTMMNEHDLLALDGTEGLVSRVAVDRCTFLLSTDGAFDIVGEVQDVTVQRSLFYGNPMTQLVKYGRRQRISIHHNVYTGNSERNPQIKGDAREVDFVSNVIHDSQALLDRESGSTYSPYGTRLWNATSDSPGNVVGNFRSNAWIGRHSELEIKTDAGASAAGIHLADNHCDPFPCPPSPAASPHPVPAAHAVTETAPRQMKDAMLPTVGAPNRTPADQARLDAVAAALPRP